MHTWTSTSIDVQIKHLMYQWTLQRYAKRPNTARQFLLNQQFSVGRPARRWRVAERCASQSLTGRALSRHRSSPDTSRTSRPPGTEYRVLSQFNPINSSTAVQPSSCRTSTSLFPTPHHFIYTLIEYFVTFNSKTPTLQWIPTKHMFCFSKAILQLATCSPIDRH